MRDSVQIFLSAVTDEFKSYRDALRKILERPNVTAKVQEQFIATGTDTLDKLDQYIRACDLVIHFVGDMTGTFARPPAAASIQARYPDFQVRLPCLTDSLESGTPPLSYTQWEAYLAVYHRKLLVIATPTNEAKRDAQFRADELQRTSQQAHLDRLRSMERHSEIDFSNAFQLSSEILRSSLLDILATLPGEAIAQQRRDRFGENQVDKLKNLLLNEAPALQRESFVFTAFVQITGSIGPSRDSSRKIDSVLIDTLAERKSAHELLMLVHLCEERSHVLGLEALSAGLNDWLTAALSACELELKAVRGRCSEALFDVSSPPAPCIEIAWKPAPADPQGRVFPEAYLRWGRCRESLAKTGAVPLAAEEVVACIVDTVERSRTYRSAPLKRLDVFVRPDELNGPWEYQPPSPLDDDPILHPWPTIVRMSRKNSERARLNPPPAQFGKSGVACLMGRCASFLQETRTRGAFFASWGGHETIDLRVLSQAASRAGVGCWLRSATPRASADKVFVELTGVPLQALPDEVHKRRLQSTAGSAWRDLSVLYDLPELPSFEFSDEDYDVQNELRASAALT